MIDSFDGERGSLDESRAGDAPSVPGFRSLGLLGAGGQRRVWLAIREADGHRAAIKVLRTGPSSILHARARVEQGYDVLRRHDQGLPSWQPQLCAGRQGELLDVRHRRGRRFQENVKVHP